MKIICKCLCSIYSRWSWGDFGEVCGDSFMWDWKFSGRLGWLQWICLALELYTANTVGNKQKQGRRTMIILWSRIESILAKTCQQRSWMLRCLDKLRPVSLAWTMKGFHFTKEGMAHTAPKLGHVEKTWNSACQRLSGCIRSFKVYQAIAIFQSTADLNLNSASLPGKEPMMRMTLELSIDMPVTKLVRRIGLSTDWKADCGTLIQLFVLFVLFSLHEKDLKRVRIVWHVRICGCARWIVWTKRLVRAMRRDKRNLFLSSPRPGKVWQRKQDEAWFIWAILIKIWQRFAKKNVIILQAMSGNFLNC